MSLNIIQELRKKPSFEAARLIGNARQYIQNDNLINLLNQYDFNNKKNDNILIKQLNMFIVIPDIRNQITLWLSS